MRRVDRAREGVSQPEVFNPLEIEQINAYPNGSVPA
jgi:hypothetical protein